MSKGPALRQLKQQFSRTSLPLPVGGENLRILTCPMIKSVFLPLLLPLVLLTVSFWRIGIVERYSEFNLLKKQSETAQLKLDELRAMSVAAKIYQKTYHDLVLEFSELAGLSLDEDFALTKGEVAGEFGRFVDAVTEELQREEYVFDGGSYLLFRSVTPGQRQVFEPFLSLDFEMNLEGRFFALPGFLERLSLIAQEQRCSISVGELKVVPLHEGGNTGELAITLPLRVYFLEK